MCPWWGLFRYVKSRPGPSQQLLTCHQALILIETVGRRKSLLIGSVLEGVRPLFIDLYFALTYAHHQLCALIVRPSLLSHFDSSLKLSCVQGWARWALYACTSRDGQIPSHHD